MQFSLTDDLVFVITSMLRGGNVSRGDNTNVIGDNNGVRKPRCYRKPQRGIVSRSSCYVATRPVIGQNLHRGYTNHSFVVKI